MGATVEAPDHDGLPGVYHLGEDVAGQHLALLDVALRAGAETLCAAGAAERRLEPLGLAGDLRRLLDNVWLSPARMKIFAPKLLKIERQFSFIWVAWSTLTDCVASRPMQPCSRQSEKNLPSPALPGISETMSPDSSHSNSGRSKFCSLPERTRACLLRTLCMNRFLTSVDTTSASPDSLLEMLTSTSLPLSMIWS